MKFYSLLIIIALPLLMAAGHRTGDVQLSFFRVETLQSDLVISWQSQLEVEVKSYELQRMTRLTNNRFVKVTTLDPHGIDKSYIFRDTQVFKSPSEPVDYRLEVVYVNGLREELARKQINYTSTAIRRTWGSIKAMFQ